MVINEPNNRKVVVLSRNYSTGLSVIRSLGTAGYEVELVASAPREGASDFIARSRFVTASHEAVARKLKDEEDDGLMAILRSYASEDLYQGSNPVLIPADDYTASVMDLHRTELEDIFLMPGIIGEDPGSLIHMMDKSVQGEIARSVGIQTPQEWVVSLRENVIIPQDMIYPCYVKPLGSIGGYKQEMARCDNREELMGHLLKMKDSFENRSVLVQEFVSIDHEYDIEGVSLGDHAIIPGVISKDYVAQYDKGVPLYGDMEPLDVLGDFIVKIREFLAKFNYFGMFDLGINRVGDEFWFNELNLRSGGTNYVYFESGCNLSDLFVKAALKENITEEETKVKEFGKKYLYEKVAWDDYFHEYLTREELDGLTDTADIHIMVNDYDSVPGELFMESVLEEEKRIRARKNRDMHIASIMEKSGLDRDTVRAGIRDARERFKVSYKDYDQFDLWKFELEHQEEEYRKALERKERRARQKEACIAGAMEYNGWDRETAAASIKDTRSRLKVSFKEYLQYELFKYSPDDQEEEYRRALERKERIAKQREECVNHAIDLAGWDEDHAIEQINEARKRLGITYNEYRKNNFCLMTPEEQDAAYEKIKSRKAEK